MHSILTILNSFDTTLRFTLDLLRNKVTYFLDFEVFRDGNLDDYLERI